MKRILSILSAVAISAILAVLLASMPKHAVPAVHADVGFCGVGTLFGNYAFSNAGFNQDKLGKKQQNPLAAAGVLNFDGAGTASITYTQASAGVISRSLSSSGTYDVPFAACMGSLSFTAGAASGKTFDIVIIGNGTGGIATEVLGVETTTSFTSTFDAKKMPPF